MWWNIENGSGVAKIVYIPNKQWGKKFLPPDATVEGTYVAHGPGYLPEDSDELVSSLPPKDVQEEILLHNQQITEIVESLKKQKTPYKPPVWERMRELLPPESIKTVVECPGEEVWGYPVEDEEAEEGCGWTDSVWSMIQHLNDDHKWSRERIADWLDTLDVDLTFRIPEDE